MQLLPQTLEHMAHGASEMKVELSLEGGLDAREGDTPPNRRARTKSLAFEVERWVCGVESRPF